MRHGWKRIHSFSDAGPLEPHEVDEMFRLCMVLPLCFTNLRAKVVSKVTRSDASEYGGAFVSVQA